MAKMQYFRDKTPEEKKLYWRKYNADARWRSSKARCFQHTPPWSNSEKIREIYLQAVLLEEETGQKYEVDHIIPLNGENVCGLHVENNLQLLLSGTNQRKSNKHNP